MGLKHPLLLILLIVLILGGYSLFYYFNKAKKTYLWENLDLFSTQKSYAIVSPQFLFLKILKSIFRLLIIVSLIILISRPQVSFPTNSSRKGIDLIFTIDRSGSMGETDIQPTRLQGATEAIKELLTGLENDRAGLVAFTGDPITLCPLTFDYEILEYYLEMLNSDNAILFVGSGGTAIGNALVLSSEKFEDDPARTKVIVLVTDGESIGGIDPLEAANHAKEKGVKVYSIFIASRDGSRGLGTLQQISEMTAGKTYEVQSKTALSEAIQDIQSLEKTELDIQNSAFQVDYPLPFMITLGIGFAGYLLINKLKLQ